MRISIRSKIFLVVFTVSVIFVLISAIVMNILMARIANDEVTQNLRVGKEAYERFIALRYSLIESEARILSQTPHLRAVMNIPDVNHETVLYTAQPLSKINDMSLMLLLDSHGKLLADVSDPSASGHDFQKFPGMQEALNGAEYNGIWRYKDNLYPIVIIPMIMEDHLLGLLILGDLLDSSAAEEIRYFTGRDVLILDSEKLIALSRGNPEYSEVDPAEIAHLVNILENFETLNSSPDSPFRVVLGRKECLAVAVPFGNRQGYTILFRALDEVDTGVDVIRRAVLGAAGGTIILALLLSLWVSGRVSRPIRDLRDSAEQFGAGNLEKRVRVHSSDELGQLGIAFNNMADNLNKSRTELIEAQERLVRTERLAAIGELSGGVAHELRNPLGAIKNAAYYIKRRLLGSDLVKDEPKIGEFLEIMDEEIETSNQVITDLMDFSRVNPPKLSPTKLEAVVDSALSRLEVKENVKVVLEFDPSFPEVAVDTEQLRRAFGNLIKNADEAMPEGGTLTITAKTVNGFVELQFRDTGQGISEADLPKVLDPLFTTKPKGVGLGLAIINSIIEMHQGSVEVNSKQGEGATFTIRLPLSNQQETQSSESEE
ncbi:MAG: HAMP domain-containing protein [Candidatus Marinimicrobia bacterium]|nr:HAMP domain-containing protein [Candidatus Neomarinimicrobiota bacterium]